MKRKPVLNLQGKSRTKAMCTVWSPGGRAGGAGVSGPAAEQTTPALPLP